MTSRSPTWTSVLRGRLRSSSLSSSPLPEAMARITLQHPHQDAVAGVGDEQDAAGGGTHVAPGRPPPIVVTGWPL